MIPLTDWNSYLKNVYKSRIFLDKIPKVSIEDDVFSIEDIKFRVK
jgi:hypothetical protein